MSASKPSFATFWAGEGFPAYEAACLSSFVRHGYEMAVYSFDEISNLPPGVELRPAGEIVEERFVHAFLIKGKPSLSHFSDLFRYRLFQKTQATWVDSDMYLLRPFDIELPTTLLAREDAQALCGAIMRLDQANPALGQLVDKTEAVAGRNLVWGQTGPRLLTSVFGADVMARSYGPEQFFPIHYDEFWKVFLPEYQAECAALCEKAYTLHLWNNIVTKVGVWKDVLPPKGSYLERLFVEDGMEHLFQGTFPASAMHHVIDNYRMRLSGNFNDVTKLAQLALPGIKRRTVRQIERVRDRLTGRS
jgi:hypothetical protein